MRMDVPTSEELKNLQDRFRELKKTCFILGASGETGKVLLAEILRLQLFSQVTLIGRRKLNLEGELYRNVRQELVDFEKLDDYAAAFQGHDVGFCSLGVPRLKAGDDEYVRVNRDYIVHSARLAKAGGCHHFVLVSASNADSSSMFFVLQVKGEAEDGVQAVGFDTVSILQPRKLLGDREEFRLLEWIARKITEVVTYVFPRFFAVPINFVAKAMVNLVVMAQANGQKLQVLTNDMIHTFGNIE